MKFHHQEFDEARFQNQLIAVHEDEIPSSGIQWSQIPESVDSCARRWNSMDLEFDEARFPNQLLLIAVHEDEIPWIWNSMKPDSKMLCTKMKFHHLEFDEARFPNQLLLIAVHEDEIPWIWNSMIAVHEDEIPSSGIRWSQIPKSVDGC